MYRFLLTLTATAAILTTASLMPDGAAADPGGEQASIAKAHKQTAGLKGLDRCQFYGQEGDRRERLEQERRERRERREQERHEPH